MRLGYHKKGHEKSKQMEEKQKREGDEKRMIEAESWNGPCEEITS